MAEVAKEMEVPKEPEAANMVCPNCHTFQPRARVCDQCGVIIEKVLNPNKTPLGKRAAADDKPKTNKLWLVLLIACFIFYLSKENDEEPGVVAANDGTRHTTAQESPEPVTAANPDIALKMQRDKVITKLQALKSTLYMLSAEGRLPPSNEEGLESLLDEGLLTKAEITDEWGNTFVYRLEWGEQVGLEREYQIFVHSRGPDGVSGNADDIAMP